jgi:hypothetical protein
LATCFKIVGGKGANIEHGKVFSKTNLSPKISGNAAAWEWLRLDVKTKKR